MDAVTDDKSLPKAERKRQQVEHAAHVPHGAKLIKLADKTANGFVLDGDTPHALWVALERACQAWHDKRLWQRIQQNGMRRDFSWQQAAADYVALYRDALAPRH